MKIKKSKKSDQTGYAFVGCLLIGLAIGQLYGRPDVGVLAGLGFGFLAMLLVSLKN